MEGFNRVFLIGTLGSDPEFRVTQTSEAVMNLRVACSERYLDRNKQRQERTEWVNVVLWGKQAEGLSKFLNKGMLVHVEGSLQTRSWEDRGGNKRYSTEVKARHVMVLSQKSDGQRQTDRSPPPAQDSDDIPF